MIKAGIIGATGYAGEVLAALLAGHKEVEVVAYCSKSYAGQNVQDVNRNLYGIVDAVCEEEDLDALCKQADVVFTATPQGYLAQRLKETHLSQAKVIDLSADFRFADTAVYEAWYGMKHQAKELAQEAVYGLPELYRDHIRFARLVANPGCYTTCSILALYPLLEEGLIDEKSLIVDALSGVSGAGRGAKVDNLYCEVNEGAKPYGAPRHRHTPEIETYLAKAAGTPVTISFTPHLVPMNRGILVTAYAHLCEGVTAKDLQAAYEKRFRDEHFVRLLPEGVFADTKWVRGSNFVDIGFIIDERTGRVVVSAALDNLMKGAASQAVQNMNLLFGLDEKEGIAFVPQFP